jgi:hypothetical protein
LLLKQLLERLPVLTLRQFAVLSVFFIGFLSGAVSLGNYDTWWHLAGGRFIIQTGHVAHTDPFSFTVLGKEWVMHEWGWDVILYLLYHWTGPVGAIILKAVVAGLIYAGMLYLAMRRGASTPVALLVTVLATQALSVWMNERPQIMQPLFVLGALHLFHSYRQGKQRTLLWYPVLMVLWVNVHGSFPIGIVLFVIFAGCELLRVQGLGLRRQLPVLMIRPSAFIAMILVLAVVACFLGPNGVRGALYPLDYINGTLKWATENVQEWKSPNWHESYLMPIEAMLLLTFIALALSPVSPAPFDLLTVLLGVHMLLQWGRNGPLMATLCTPVLALHLSAWVDALRSRRPKLEDELDYAVATDKLPLRVATWMVVLALVVMCAIKVPWCGPFDKRFELSTYPVKAAEVVALNKLEGRMWNVYHWGGYLVWRFYRERPVFIDGRADVYGQAIWDDYRKISMGLAGWKEMLDKYDVQYLIIEPGYAICRTLDISPDFTKIYGDTKAAIYVRAQGQNKAAIEKAKAGKLILPKDDRPDLKAWLG